MKSQNDIEDGWFFHNHAWHLLHEIIKLIPDDCESLLDCGAGTGIAAAVIKAVKPNIRIMVTDVAKESFEFWTKRDIAGVLIESEKIPLKDSMFDFVMSSHVLEHVNDPVLFVNEMIRVAKKRVVIVVPDGDCHFYDHKKIYDRATFYETLNKASLNVTLQNIHTFPVYHPHINNLVGVIDL